MPDKTITCQQRNTIITQRIDRLVENLFGRYDDVAVVSPVTLVALVLAHEVVLYDAPTLDSDQHLALNGVTVKLDKAREKHPDMVLLHGGSPRGAERIAACWAESRKVTQIAFKPDWNRHAKAAPFRRNDQLLSVMPYGLIVFPGSGITENLADKARRLGIPVWRFTENGA